MANIEDYLDWRNDIPFSVDPFNEVDNLILSELVYSPFDGIVPGPGVKTKISLEDVCEKFFEIHTEEELLQKTTITKYAPFLMKKMVKSKRYSGIKLTGFINEVDSSTQSQFAAVTYYLPDNSIYVAFRGTDDSLIGWREDFNMCFSKGTAGQIKAVEYLNSNFYRTMKPIRVGGHSKGGNFAVYGSAFCRDTVKENIIDVFSNDGPGFVDEVTKSKEYKSIVKLIRSYIPDQSIIGMLMDHKYTSQIIKSSAKGINQHDAFTWQIVKNRFVQVDNLNSSSIMLDDTIKKWVKDFDYDTRNLFGEILFSSLSIGGQTKLSEVTHAKFKSAAQITKAISALDKEQQALVYQVTKKLVAAGGDTFKNTMIAKIGSLNNKG